MPFGNTYYDPQCRSCCGPKPTRRLRSRSGDGRKKSLRACSWMQATRLRLVSPAAFSWCTLSRLLPRAVGVLSGSLSVTLPPHAPANGMAVQALCEEAQRREREARMDLQHSHAACDELRLRLAQRPASANPSPVRLPDAAGAASAGGKGGEPQTASAQVQLPVLQEEVARLRQRERQLLTEVSDLVEHENILNAKLVKANNRTTGPTQRRGRCTTRHPTSSRISRCNSLAHVRTLPRSQASASMLPL